MTINRRVPRKSTTESNEVSSSSSASPCQHQSRLKDCIKMRKLIFIAIISCAVFTVAIRSRENRNEIVYLRNALGKVIKELPALECLDCIKDLIEKGWRVQESLEKISNSNEIAKRTNFNLQRPDLALHNSGGKIVGIGRDTKLLHHCSWYMKLLGCPRQKFSPQKMLETSMYPGDCFGFHGNTAKIYIRLIGPAIVDSVAIEHISKQMSPNGNVSDAPRSFSVYAFNEISQATDAHFLGKFTFEANQTTISTFILQKTLLIPSKYIKIEFHENNGNPEMTCVYRLRIHGILNQNWSHLQVKA